MGEQADGDAALRTSRLSLRCNAALVLFKLCAGLLAGSAALVSDGFHSLADTGGSLIVLLGMKLSVRDESGRWERAASVILSGALGCTALLLGAGSLRSLLCPEAAAPPGPAAGAAAALSALFKELLYRRTRRTAEETGSPALMAEARHHRSDALCSLGVLPGIFGARHGLPRLDAAAGLCISGLILCSAAAILRDSPARRKKP